MKNTLSLIALSISLSALPAVAQSHAAGEGKTPTAEQRQKMAEHHEKMATCLRSDRPLSECKQEMMKNCEETMGKGGCPMMGDHMGRGHHHAMEEGGKKK